jgi:hypothetical protein
MKKIFSILLFAALIIFITSDAYAQGCVAIKGSGTSCMMSHTDPTSKPGWQFTTGARYFKSFRHFSGKEENKDRLIQNTEVINHSATLDLALTRIINDRWSVMIDVPIISNARSSLYEHGLVNGQYVKKERHSMHSFGISDIRIAAYRWMLDPVKHHKANIQLGLGIKLPTGDYNYKDYWYNVAPDGGKGLRTVDQSIQLGDGGTGFTVEANTFYNFTNSLGVYGNFFYLVNPREQNGVRTYRETITPVLANEAICSVPDQYMARAGVNYSFSNINGLSVAAGARIEGIPVYDLIGGSGDFRRPGYAMSVEPALNFAVKKFNFSASVPVVFERNRTQSVTDKENSIIRNTFVRGDAAFADYVVNVGMSVRF